MSYSSLGATYWINLPVIGKQRVDIPLEQVARDAANAAWPPVQAKLRAEIPKFMAQATPVLEKQVKLLRNTLIGVGIVLVGMEVLTAYWIKKG